jgi:cysteine desulfuration protein SufE
MSAPASGSGSAALDQMVERLSGTSDPKRRYEYVLWLGKKLQPFPDALRQDIYKVRGCASQVYVVGELQEGRLHWEGDSDAAITKGLLALLMQGMEGLTPEEALALDPEVLAATGLQASLTPSRANGFLSIFRTMQAQASQLKAA